MVDHVGGSRALEFIEASRHLVPLAALDQKVDNGCEVLASLEELFGDPVLLESIDVSGDLLLVEKVVLGDFGGKFANLSELLAPSLDLGEVLRHVSAGVKLLRDLEADLNDLKGTLGDVIPATTFKLADCLLELVGHFFATTVASLDLLKLILTDHAFNEASKNVVKLESGALGGSNDCWRRNVLKESVSHVTEVLA